MRACLALLTLLVAMAAATGASATGAASSGDADPEQMLTLPRLSQDMPSKQAWPELVGKEATEAKAELEAQLPASMRILLVPQGSLMTMDFRTDRIRIIYNQETGLVTSPPRIG